VSGKGAVDFTGALDVGADFTQVGGIKVHRKIVFPGRIFFENDAFGLDVAQFSHFLGRRKKKEERRKNFGILNS
jgi:hypothetical protein